MTNAAISEAIETAPRSEYDYEDYVRMRKLNVALTKWAPRATSFLLLGAIVAGAGYHMREAAPVVGMDPAGRSYQLQMLSVPNQGK